ncbi:MAG: hypothetical protein R2912_01225 [Eubacteriales bacterium]
MQHIGLLSLCLLARRQRSFYLLDESIASLLSFRTLEELFNVFRGDREQLCDRLVGSAADPYIRRTCVKAIGNNKYTALAPEVMPLLNSLQLNMKIDAARTLGQLCYAPAYEHILKMQA